jgi:malate dehydrogenase (oxaloacetate-decarboxylating)(NADP+)
MRSSIFSFYRWHTSVDVDLSSRYLERYRHQNRCFNDDVTICRYFPNPISFFSQIQGTGAVVLSGFINAARLASEASSLPLTEHRILFFGAGSAGVGVAKQLLSFFTMLGLSKEEARQRIYVSCLSILSESADSL